MDSLGGYQFKDRMLRWAAGPTITAMLDSIQDAARFAKNPEKAEKFMGTLLRSWVPGGIQLQRVGRAMENARTPDEALSILLNAAPEQKKRATPKELR